MKSGPQSGGKAPVSYTHLDVYKRQIYGSDFIRRTTLTDPALQGLTSEQLLAKIGDLMGKQHEVLYYGPQDEAEVKAALAAHHKVAADLQPLEKKFSTLQPTDENKVMLAQYDAKQLYYCLLYTSSFRTPFSFTSLEFRP